MDDDIPDEDIVIIPVKDVSGKQLEVCCNRKGTVGELKTCIHEQHEVEEVRQKVIFRGRVLLDYLKLDEQGISEDAGVHLVISRERPAPPTIVRPQPQQPLMNDAMRQAAEPFFQSMLDNPEMVRSMLLATQPGMQRAIDNNPELAHALSDPSTLRQAIEVMRNPTLFADMSRNVDFQLTQVMNIPEGARRVESLMNDLNSIEPEFPTTQTSHIPAAPATGPLPNPWAVSQPQQPQHPQQQQQQQQPNSVTEAVCLL